MKKKQKVFASLAAAIVLASSMAVSASASTYTFSPFSFTTSTETSNCKFDCRPANKVRFIVNPSCVIDSARVQYELHTDVWHVVQPDTQYYGMGPKRPWWYCKEQSYHVYMKAQNNTNDTKTAPISMNGTTWFENFEGDVG